MRFDREDKSLITDWWFTVDRVLLIAILVLMGVGIIVSLAASPAVADNKGLDAFYFVKRHVLIVLTGAVLMAMYDGGILYSDALLGRVTEALRAAGRLDDTILVVLADHGELVGEHGIFGHGFALYEPMIRVPFLIRYPRRLEAGARVTTPVSTVGVYATVFDLLGIELPAPVHVASLVPAVGGGPPGGPALSERFAAQAVSTTEEDPLSRADVRFRSYRAGSMKLIEASDGTDYLFDLEADPGETRDLASSDRAEVARLKGELNRWRAAVAVPGIDAPLADVAAPAIDPAAQERLRQLGYVE